MRPEELKDSSPVSGDFEAVLPLIDELSRDWLLFKTDRKSLQRKNLAGRSKLFNLRFHMGPKHTQFVQSRDPLAIALQTLSKPLLLMPEYSCSTYTLGCGWAITDSSSSSGSDLSLSRDSTFKRTRFMEFSENNVLGNVIQTYDCDDSMIVFGWTRELDSRRSKTVNGLVDKETGNTAIIHVQFECRNCEQCEFFKRECRCDSKETERAFESRFLVRREFGRRATFHLSNAGTADVLNWLTGSYTTRNISSPIPMYHFDIWASDHGENFHNCLSFVIQDEILKNHPPRQSQIFLSYKSPQVSKGFISSLRSVSETVEDRSRISGVEQEETTTDVIKSTSASKEMTEDAVGELSQVSKLNNSGTQQQVVREVGNNRRSRRVLGGQLITSILLEGRTGEQSGDEYRTEPSNAQQPLTKEVNLKQKNEETSPTANNSSDSNSARINVCMDCGMAFKRRYDLGRHRRTVHEKRRDYACKLCRRKFSQSGHLNEHIKVQHQKDASHICSTCGKVFGAKGKLDRHVQSVHDNLRIYKCDQCEKSFKDPSSLRHHVKSVHMEKPAKNMSKDSGPLKKS